MGKEERRNDETRDVKERERERSVGGRWAESLSPNN